VTLRLAARSLLFVLWTAVSALVALLGRVLLWPSPVLAARWAGMACWLWGRGACPALGLRVRVEGPPPPPGSFVACNHVSWSDILTLGYACRAVFIAKVEISRWPVMGWLGRIGNTIWVDRRRMRDTARLREVLHRYLSRGVRINIFAEGGAGSGEVIRPFRPPLFESPAALGVPCVPTVIRYADSRYWWPDEQPLIRHFLAVARLPRSEVVVRFGEPVTGITDRKELAAELHRRAAALYGPSPQAAGRGS